MTTFQDATKLSELLEIAIHDARIMSRRKEFRFTPWIWVSDDGCQACLAGCILVYQNISLEALTNSQDTKIRAVNNLREGNVAYAACNMQLPMSKVSDRMYRDEHLDECLIHMDELLAELKAVGE